MRTKVIIVMACFLIACGSESETDFSSNDASTMVNDVDQNAEMDEYAQEYQRKVAKRFGDSIVGSLANDWNVSEEEVRCLLKDVPLEKFEFALTDPEVTAVFEDCGVNPDVIKL